jgi:hypothetical protein
MLMPEVQKKEGKIKAISHSLALALKARQWITKEIK